MTQRAPRVFFILLTIGIGTLLALPVLASMGWHTPYVFASPEWISSIIERALGVFFAIGGVLILVYYKQLKRMIFKRAEPPENYSSPYPVWILFVLSGMMASSLLYTMSSYDSLYLGDFDFTGISAALNQTSRGHGVLPTPYYDSGVSFSYLGHHFAPALLLLVPFYILGDALLAAQSFTGELPFLYQLAGTHFLYGAVLWIVLAATLFVWASYLRKEADSDYIALFATAILVTSLPLWRLTQSFHFELLAVLFAGLTFSREKKQSSVVFWVFLVLWMTVKEDIAIYTLFYGLGTLVENSIPRRRSVGIVLLSLFYFAFAVLLRNALAGGAGPDWTGWIYTDWSNSSFSIKPAVVLVASLAFLPILSGRFFLAAVVPVMAIHIVSGHPWFSSFQGHYVYGLAPLLFRTITPGFRRLTEYSGIQPLNLTAMGSLLLAISLYIAGGEKASPAPVVPPAEEYPVVQQIGAALPEGSCIRAQFPFSPHMPLYSSVYPLIGPSTPANVQLPERCTGGNFVILQPSSPMEPYYDRRALSRMQSRAEANMNKREYPYAIYLFHLSGAENGETERIGIE